jgi:hypothetical protein
VPVALRAPSRLPAQGGEGPPHVQGAVGPPDQGPDLAVGGPGGGGRVHLAGGAVEPGQARVGGAAHGAEGTAHPQAGPLHEERADGAVGPGRPGQEVAGRGRDLGQVGDGRGPDGRERPAHEQGVALGRHGQGVDGPVGLRLPGVDRAVGQDVGQVLAVEAADQVEVAAQVPAAGAVGHDRVDHAVDGREAGLEGPGDGVGHPGAARAQRPHPPEAAGHVDPVADLGRGPDLAVAELREDPGGRIDGGGRGRPGPRTEGGHGHEGGERGQAGAARGAAGFGPSAGGYRHASSLSVVELPRSITTRDVGGNGPDGSPRGASDRLLARQLKASVVAAADLSGRSRCSSASRRGRPHGAAGPPSGSVEQSDSWPVDHGELAHTRATSAAPRGTAPAAVAGQASRHTVEGPGLPPPDAHPMP